MMRLIEVCAGAGGLSKGFIDTGFIPVFLNDIDKYCIQTLRLNHPLVTIHEGDMTEINLDTYQSIDILLGGVPCQSFSHAREKERCFR